MTVDPYTRPPWHFVPVYPECVLTVPGKGGMVFWRDPLKPSRLRHGLLLRNTGNEVVVQYTRDQTVRVPTKHLLAVPAFFTTTESAGGSDGSTPPSRET